MLNKNDHSVDKRVRRFTFKPRLIWITLLIVSTMKKVEEAAMLPTNLHINDIVIKRRNVMSCDSLNSLFRKSLSYLSFPRITSSSSSTCLFYAILWDTKCLFLQVSLWRIIHTYSRSE